MGEELVTPRAGAEEIERGFLDPVFGFAPQTGEIVVEGVGGQVERAGDEARGVALAVEFEPGDDSSFSIPALGGIGEFVEDARLFLALRVFPFEFAFAALDDPFQSGMLRHSNDLAHFLAFAPADQALTTEA